MQTYIKNFLEHQQQKNLLRDLKIINKKNNVEITVGNRKYIDFSSNDYLSLSNHKYLINKSIEFTERYGTGGNASRLLSGTMDYHILLEEKIAELKDKGTGLIFGSGFIANTSIIPALVGKDDVIFADKFVHASIIDGIILSRCKFFRFNHNDINHLETMMKLHRHKYKNSLIITESVFSMDGDIASLKDIVDVKYKYNSLLYVDEAHATGVFGKKGAGIIEKFGLTDDVDIIMGTFGKALGSYGAYITASQHIKKFLINKARGFIYSTALPASVIGASIGAIELLSKEPARRKQLLENSNYLRDKLQEANIEIEGESQIIPVIIGESKKAVLIAELLQERGYFILPIRPPTVPIGTARLRLSLNYGHSKNILKKFIQDFLEIYETEIKK